MRLPEAVDIAPWDVPRNDIRTSQELGRGGCSYEGNVQRRFGSCQIPTSGNP